MTARQALRRFLILTGLRWLPVGLMIPVGVLLPLDRGLTLAQWGSAAALQGLIVLLLELPTGGLSDAIGRRPVLIIAGVVDLAALSLLTFADTVAMFTLYFVLQGVYRALDSGPLDAWYVDHALAADPEADFETGLAHSGTVVGVAIGAGALLTGGLVAWGPLGLTLPVYVALLCQLVALAAVVVLLTEDRPARGVVALLASVRGVPAAVAGALGLLRRSRVIVALIAVELFWGFGMVAFESLTPVRLADVLGDADRASALMGPVGSVAWLASAAGAALIPFLVRRIGAPWTGFTLRVVQGVTVAGMALFAGPVGVIASFLVCYAVHGASSPVHMGLLHRQVEGPYRASLLSLNSMVAMPAGSVGMIVLTAIASGASLVAALAVGAVVLALAAPLYLVARRPRFAAEPQGGISTAVLSPP
ncbi:MFS transporter [Symbioplanes lichenis]|uniref:MFS transporter n=1 Tax=Symbioplanes lichenis TaxID=1629072 RepID=UPI0027389C3B|nr:MFS transporter [Actinoplanes lichenis]